jgi:zinc-ribbon domain
MASSFCIACGKPLPSGAQFCTSCGHAVPSVTSGGTAGPAPPAAPDFVAAAAPAPPPASPVATSLAPALGLAGGRSFLLQHQLIGAGHSYRVLDREKRHLFTVKEDLGGELRANFLGRMGQQQPGFYLGRLGPVTRTFSWWVVDGAGNVQGTITIQLSGRTAVSALSDANGAPVFAVSVDRGMMGGMTATAAYPDGRAMLEAKGNLMHHSFSIHDASGREVAKIHEAWASVRDTYTLDLVGEVDPVYPVIFAMLIDREKEAN